MSTPEQKDISNPAGIMADAPGVRETESISSGTNMKRKKVKLMILREDQRRYREAYDRGYRDAMKEQEVRELTIEEWYEWKANSRRDPICLLWENDTTPMWILDPNDVHEPALLMGKIKLFNQKPTFEQCKAVKWGERIQ